MTKSHIIDEHLGDFAANSIQVRYHARQQREHGERQGNDTAADLGDSASARLLSPSFQGVIMREKLSKFLTLGILISGCSLQPKAKLTLAAIEREGRLATVIFDSDIDILSPHRANKYQIPTSTVFHCVMGSGELSDEIDSGLAGIGGLIEPVGMTVHADGRSTYRFKSGLVFSEAVGNSSASSKLMTRDEIASLLSTQSRMRCRVRILAYLSKRYFSEPVAIPLRALRLHFEALAREENSDDR